MGVWEALGCCCVPSHTSQRPYVIILGLVNLSDVPQTDGHAGGGGRRGGHEGRASRCCENIPHRRNKSQMLKGVVGCQVVKLNCSNVNMLREEPL